MPVILPVLDRPFHAVLDIGCGESGTLSALSLPDSAIRVGLDVDAESMKAAQRHAADVHFAAGDGHVLPFRTASFDLVISKVAFPYLNIPVAIREVHRVLGAGGTVWMTLHPLAMTAMRILGDIKAARLQDAVYQSYAIVNGLLLAVAGRQFPYPFNRRRMESFQTVRGIANALHAAGFTDVRFERRKRGPGYESSDRRLGKVFAVSARKPRT